MPRRTRPKRSHIQARKPMINRLRSLQEKTDEPEEEPEAPVTEEYILYLEEHAKKLKRLEREANGENFKGPPNDYD